MGNELHTMPLKLERLYSSLSFRGMKWDERGAYLLLLCEAWLKQGYIPAIARLQKAALNGISDADFDRISEVVIKPMFKPDGQGNLYNESNLEIYNEVLLRLNKLKEAGRKGGYSHAKAMLKPCLSIHAIASKAKSKTKLSKDSKKAHTFKTYSFDEFNEEVKKSAVEKNMPEPMRIAFLDYWTEKSASGLMKFQKQDTWETSKRISTWINNQAKFEANKPNTTSKYEPPAFASAIRPSDLKKPTPRKIADPISPDEAAAKVMEVLG